MKYPTPADIAEMKARGFEAETIRLAEAQMEHGKEATDLCRMIEEAFRDVKLGNGVGLFQAQGLDDYADEATCAAYREKDEKDDWRRITSENLCRCDSSLSFFDAEGMRFHLPAYLICDLKGEYGMGMDFCLTHMSVDTAKFNLLSPEQRLCVRFFLLRILHSPEYELSRSDILHALDYCWIWPPELRP